MTMVIQKGCREVFLQAIVVRGMDMPLNRKRCGVSAHESVRDKCMVATKLVHSEIMIPETGLPLL